MAVQLNLQSHSGERMAMQLTTKNQTVLLTPKEAAARLRVSESTLAKWRMTALRELAFVKVGHKVLYDEREVERFIAAQMRKSTSDTGAEAA
jgi:excisionase family DNA binding protein